MGPGRPGARHPRRHPGLLVRRCLPGRHRRLPGQRRLRPVHHGLGAERRPDGAEGRGVRLPRQDLRGPDRGHRPSGRPGRQRADRAGGRRGRHLPRLPDQGRPDPRLGQAGRHPCPRHRRPGRVLAGRGPRPRRAADRQGQAVPAGARHRGPGHPHPLPGRGRQAVGGAHPPRREHHLGHRQRAARLPDRPLPDPGAGHQRQDAVGRPADGGRRPVRDGRRRFRAQARPAAGQGELPALGLARRVLRARALPGAVRAGHRQCPGQGARRHAGPRHGDLPQRGQVPDPSRRRHRQPRQPLLPVPVLGAGAGQADRRRRPGQGLRAARRVPRGRRAEDRGRAERRPGHAGRPRRLLPRRPGQGGRGDAPVGHLERGPGLALVRIHGGAPPTAARGGRSAVPCYGW
ncbi:hypothetical protein SGPA1_10066 [Streptomyces misionensis JCM 4497]